MLTYNGIQFTMPDAGGSAVPEIRQVMGDGETFRAHSFELACAASDTEHQTTNQSIPDQRSGTDERDHKDATVKHFHYQDQDQLRRHLDDFVAAYNFARRSKTLGGFTPNVFVCSSWITEPERLSLNPLQQLPELNI